MAIIIVKPTQGDQNYATLLATYESYLQDIRVTVWSDLTKEQLPDSIIESRTNLRAAEREIISRSGLSIADRAGFMALSTGDQDKLIEGTILQTALYLLPTVPQLKRAEQSELQAEYYQVSDREKVLQSRLDLLYPTTEPEEGDPIPSGGECIDFFTAF